MLPILPCTSLHFASLQTRAAHRPLYLDIQATTPQDPRVLDAMLPYMMDLFGNAHSQNHSFGWEAEAAVERSRSQIAELLNCMPQEIIFTSGATESNNMALKGIAHFHHKKNKRHIITSQIEHKCILDSCRHLERDGYRVTYLPVQPNGVIDPSELEKAIDKDTLLVSIMTTNNEIGTIQPISQLSQIAKDHGAFFHTDAAQAIGKIDFDIQELKNVDLVSLTAHKIYGPKGIGALYIRRRPRVRLSPLINGGGQERGYRSGTLPVPLCVGFGEAAALASLEKANDYQHVSQLSNHLKKRLSNLEMVYFNGSDKPYEQYPGCTNYSFSCVEGESLLMALPDIAVSSGSACTSASLEPSYVLRALNIDDELAHSSLRFGIGRFTTLQEVDYTCDQLDFSVKKLREMSPLWEMVQDGVDLSQVQWSQHNL